MIALNVANHAANEETDARTALETLLSGSPFLSYAYSYPHKTAYRPLTPPLSLADVWADESKNETALYLHIPFCEMRCGFCNLFTTANPTEERETQYLNALGRQADAVANALPAARCNRAAFGGGTPTFLSVAGLERALHIAARFAPLAAVPFSVETSPRTATPEKLATLRQGGVDRISMGIQSFVEGEVRAIGRGQRNEDVFAALEQIRALAFPTLNLDFMYGLPGQTAATWAFSLRAALRFEPEELYLYPLYIRPLTGLDGKALRHETDWDAQRLTLYRQARETLLSSGYEQVSLRFFRKIGAATHPSSDAIGGNLIGIGCGARSYTRAVHYSSEWAVGRTGVNEIITDYIARSPSDFATITYGATLTTEEQKRRFLIYFLLQQAEGVPINAYRERFRSEFLEDFPYLSLLLERELALGHEENFSLTAAGWERADVLGPWLTSRAMRAKMEGFPLR